MCQCSAGYTGSTCDVEIDECASAICPNDSVCVDGVNAFQCVCSNGAEYVDNGCTPSGQYQLLKRCFGSSNEYPISYIGIIEACREYCESSNYSATLM